MSESLPDHVHSLPQLHLPCRKGLDETSNCQKYPVITSSCCPLRSGCILGQTLIFSSLSPAHRRNQASSGLAPTPPPSSPPLLLWCAGSQGGSVAKIAFSSAMRTGPPQHHHPPHCNCWRASLQLSLWLDSTGRSKGGDIEEMQLQSSHLSNFSQICLTSYLVNQFQTERPQCPHRSAAHFWFNWSHLVVVWVKYKQVNRFGGNNPSFCCATQCCKRTNTLSGLIPPCMWCELVWK